MLLLPCPDVQLTISQALSPAVQTITYLFVLTASIEISAASGKTAPRQVCAAVLPEGALWPYITHALLEFDPVQVRYVGDKLTKLVACVAQGAEQTQNYVPAIQLLHHVILRLDHSSSTFTSTHYLFIRLCLVAQAYSEAVDILDRPLYHIPTDVTKPAEARSSKYLCSAHESSVAYLTPTTGLTQKITSRMYLEFYLMAGMCHMALRQYQKALFFLEVVLVAPTQQNVASAIMVEAYKKWLLLKLLVTGTEPTIPKAASQTALRYIKTIAKPYECVAQAFKGQSLDHLRAEIEAGDEIWQEDNNYGLVVEVYQAFRKFSVLRLGKTFAAIPIAEVARRTSPDLHDLGETLAYVESLIARGDLNAVITATPKGVDILRFLPESAVKTEAQVEQDLALKIQELRLLLKHVNDLDYRMEVSREYIDCLKKLKKIKDDDKRSGVGSGHRAMDDIDEDMMEEY